MFRHILQVSFKSRTSDFQSDNGMAEFLTCSNFYLFSIIYGKVYTATKTVVVSSNTTLVITTYRDGWFDSTASHQYFMGLFIIYPLHGLKRNGDCRWLSEKVSAVGKLKKLL